MNVHFYVDGYNLLFRLLKAGENLKQEREVLVKDLEMKINLLELNATVVFDSQYQPDEASISHFRSLEIIFTAAGETADDYILKHLKDSLHPDKIQIVTSDRKLGNLCHIRLAKVMSVEAFTQMLNKRIKNKLDAQKESVQVKKESTLRPLKSQIKEKKSPLKPETNVLVEECTAYYLDTFEKQFQGSASHVSPPPKKSAKKINVRSCTEEEKKLSDRERWQRAFERKLDEK